MEKSLIGLVRRVEIAHHIPGRIRLKVDAEALSTLALAPGKTQSLFNQLGRTKGIRALSVNPAARSCLIEYDPVIIAPQGWTDLVRGEISEEAAELLKAFEDAEPYETAVYPAKAG